MVDTELSNRAISLRAQHESLFREICAIVDQSDLDGMANWIEALLLNAQALDTMRNNGLYWAHTMRTPMVVAPKVYDFLDIDYQIGF